MREIEFRGHESPLFAGENKKKKPKWLYGSLRNTSEEHPQIAEPPMGLWCNVEPETVGQYTGMKDKNGVNIYEGDVLKFSWSSCCGPVKFFGVVRFCEDGAAFKYYCERFKDWSTFCTLSPSEMEVVGNIFDDPTLEKRFGAAYREA